MRTSNPKHAVIDATLAGIPAAEPVFLLRAGDVHAQAAVRYYADRVQAAGGDPNVIAAARASVTAFAQWPTKAEPTFDGADDVAAKELAATAAQLIADGVKVGEVIELPTGSPMTVVSLTAAEVVVEPVAPPAAVVADPQPLDDRRHLRRRGV